MFINVTLVYLLLLIPLSGFIAWIGDRIGHKSGKRRHSLFGLRPRHTAMLFTIGAGMCISLLSFGLIWLLSATFRVVVRDGATLYETNQQLKGDNSRLLTGNTALQHETALLQAQADANRTQAEANRRLADRNAHLAQTANLRRDAVLRQEQAAIATLHDAQGRLETAKSDLARAQFALHGATSALATVRGELGAKTLRVQTAEKQVARAEKQIADAEVRVQVAQARAQAADADARRVEQQALVVLAEQKDRHDKAMATLSADMDAQKALFKAQEAQTAEQKLALASLNAQVEAGQTELNRIKTNTRALRERQITYQVGEEVGRVAIHPGQSIWRIEAAIQGFLTDSAKRAEARGASHTRDDRAVLILPRVVADPDTITTTATKSGEGEGHVVTEEDTVRAIADAIRRANTDVVIIASAATNTFAGEPVAIGLKTYRNPLLFAADTTIASVGIDGTGSRQEVAAALYKFLRQDVRHTLLNAGIIPHHSGAVTSGTAPDDIGAVSGEEWIQILDRVRQAGERARVVVIADRDMRAGDPVALRFDVKGVQSAALRPE